MCIVLHSTIERSGQTATQLTGRPEAIVEDLGIAPPSVVHPTCQPTAYPTQRQPINKRIQLQCAAAGKTEHKQQQQQERN
jgi:hypothetical protein